jgi:hypothetical protein
MKVLCYCPIALDGTAYWRVTGPMSRLRQQAPDVQVSIVEKVDYKTILEHDVLLLQRPFLDEHVAAAQTAHVLGRPVWCDWDDDILNVPVNNGRVLVYQNERFKANVRALLAGSDAVSVTNVELAKRFAPHCSTKPFVIPNALDVLMELPPLDPDKLPVRRVAWRGGDSHNEDLLVFGDCFPRVAHLTEGRALWNFIGFNPHWLLPQFPAASVTYNQWFGDVVAYFRFMAALRPSILAVPLVDTPFNRCKSNIAVLEASWFGAVPIVPKWLEGCALPGALTYTDKAGFEAALEAGVRMPESERLARLEALRAAVKETYTLETVNMLRALVLKRITKQEGTNEQHHVE